MGHISILLACYNGEKFIEAQLQSILVQSVGDYTLYIRDDCSTDRTWNIVQTYAEKFPDKIITAQNEAPSGGACENFFKMMGTLRDDYVMLCDQDDVWHNDKIETTLACMKALEARHAPNTPLLVHTDISVADEEMQVTIPSYKTYMKSDTGDKPFARRLIQNSVTGCTAMYNRALAEYPLPPAEGVMMHDWWLMLVAAAFGHMEYCPQSTLLYRQHRENDIGMSYVRSLRYKAHKLLHPGEMKQALAGTWRQAACFLDLFGAALPQELEKTVRAYSEMPGKSKFAKWAALLETGAYKDSLLRNIALFLVV